MRTLLLACLLGTTTFLTAQDDRDRTTPVARQWLTDVSPAVMSSLESQGWRFTDIDVTSTLPLLFSVAMVQNTGSYAKTWTYTTSMTGAQLATTVSQNNLRIVDLEPYDYLGTTYFAAVLIANTGADGKAWWWWYDQTSSQVDANLAAVNGRLTSFKRYTTNGQTRFAIVAISNTGADNRAWGYLYGASSAAITQALATGGRVYGLERIAADSYDVILIDNPAGHGHWYYYEQTVGVAQELVAQNLGRVVDVEIYTIGTPPFAVTRCFIAMLDAANTLEQTARQEFYGAASGALGDYGFFLKEVNGPVLAQMRADTVFEPASTVKTLYHVHVMRRVALGQTSLTGSINKPQACGVSGSNQTIQLTLSQMMENSDNMSTLAISNAFGLSNIDATAGALGMADTSLNFTIGCTGPAPNNALTLQDLSTLHEQVANGYLSPGLVDWRSTFYSLMQESLAFPSWGTSDLDFRMNLYALVTGMSSSALAVFKSKLKIAYKPGGIGWAPNGTPDYYYAEGGWMSVPFRSANGLLAPREYTFGVFNHFFHAQEASGRNAMCDAELELVWDRVKAAMDTWDDYVAGSITAIAGAGCPGSAGTPVQTAGSQPDLEETVVYTVDSAPAGTIAIAMFGFSNTSWGGTPLPADLGPIGAPGCVLRTEPSVMFAGLVSGSGTMRQHIVIGTDPATIGVVWYSQFLVLDPPANAFGFTISNALRTQVGGST